VVRRLLRRPQARHCGFALRLEDAGGERCLPSSRRCGWRFCARANWRVIVRPPIWLPCSRPRRWVGRRRWGAGHGPARGWVCGRPRAGRCHAAADDTGATRSAPCCPTLPIGRCATSLSPDSRCWRAGGRCCWMWAGSAASSPRARRGCGATPAETTTGGSPRRRDRAVMSHLTLTTLLIVRQAVREPSKYERRPRASRGSELLPFIPLPKRAAFNLGPRHALRDEHQGLLRALSSRRFPSQQ
jgi:hypothetical protein